MSKDEKVLFITDKKHIKNGIPSGPKICTKNYINVLKNAKLELEKVLASPKSGIKCKLKSKVLEDPYNVYDEKVILKKSTDRLEEGNVGIVAINQVNLLGVGVALKERFGGRITVIGLSHGNQSGDAVHEIARRDMSWGTFLRDTLSLGWTLVQEAQMFTKSIDLMLCMSETEKHINRWLGAERSMVVPRTFEPKFLDWSSVHGRVGFVGSLSHLPNIEGIRRVLTALEQKDVPPSVDVRIVGRPKSVGRELETSFSSATYCGRLPQEEFKSEASTWGLFLNPIWWYARGATTKLSQAIEWGIPVLTTKPGMRGYRWSKGEVQVVDTPEAMADSIIEATKKPSLLSEWAAEVRIVAQNGPSLDELGDELSDHLRSI
jgi:hypothetical protein